MKRLHSIGTVVVASTVLSSCSGGGGTGPTQPAPGQTPPPLVTRSYTFAPGNAKSTNGTAWNIVGVKTTLSGSGNNPLGNSYDTLLVETTFAQDVSNALPVPGMPLNSGAQLGVGLAIDSDGNSTTGNISSCDTSGKTLAFEYSTDVAQRLRDGNYSILFKNQPIYSGSPNPGAEAVVSASQHTIGLLINLAAIGVFKGQQVPRIGVSVVAFNGSDLVGTDCVPIFDGSNIELFTS